jgi:hypothetical protein
MSSVTPFYSSFIEILVGSKKITFISDWRFSQFRDSSLPVPTISNSAQGIGFAQNQLGFNVAIDIPVTIRAEDLVDINNISISDGTQITCTLNVPTSPNQELSFTGNTYIFDNIAPQNQSIALPEGSAATQTLNFYAGKYQMSNSG